MVSQVCKQVSNNTRVNRVGTPDEGVIAKGVSSAETLGPNGVYLYMLGVLL